MVRSTSCARCCRILLLCVVLTVVACGKDDGIGGPEAEPVATVLVMGAPVDPLIVGYRVQLAATPLNASGAALSGRQVRWASSDTSVASVSGGGLVQALRAGSATITASSEGKQGQATLDVRDGGALGSAGATLSLLEGALTVVVPPGSVSQAVTLLARPASNAPQHPRAVSGTVVELTPDPLSFLRPVSMKLRYDLERVPGGLQEASLQLYMLSAGAWNPLRGSSVDREARTVTANIARTGTYAIVSTPVNRVTLSGALVGGALYAGRKSQLLAAAFDAAGDTLRQFGVQWHSSSPGVATVDASGTVSGMNQGTATITATAAEASASTTVSVLATPVADWTRAADWVTYQGSARRDGFVAATVDPSRFTEMWTTQIGTNASVESIATVGHRVFTTITSTTQNRLVALTATDGKEAWSYAFGPVQDLGGPAYGGGRVYVQTGGHENSFLWSFDSETGQLRYRSAYGNQWSMWRAAAVVDNGVYMAGGYYGGLYRFDALSGTQTFFVTLPQTDGWAPAVADGSIFVFGTPGSYSGNGLSALFTTDGKVRYSIADARIPNAGTPVLGSRSNVLVCAASRLVAIDLIARQVAWEKNNSCSGLPTVGNGLVFAAIGDGVEAIREVDGVSRWIWTPGTGEVVLSPMIATNNVLFVGLGRQSYPYTGSRTVAVDLESGRTVWSYPAAGNMAVSAQGMLFIMESGGRLRGINLR